LIPVQYGQLHVWRETGDVKALVDRLIERTLENVPNEVSGYSPVAIAQTKGEALEMSKLIEVKLRSLRRLHRVDSSDTLQ
jgi:hypothetical protein